MNTPQRYLITAALPYANGPLHIGHIAGAYLPADIYVRYLRNKGRDVVFVCGSDEHGVAITIQAKKEGVTPSEIIDKYHELNKTTFEQLDISFDIFHRTSSPLHHETSSKFFRDLYDQGVFEERESEQYFDETFQQFLADRYIIGTCPKCANPNAYGDQCEKCGTSLSPDDLIAPRSAMSGETPVKKKTTHWYLPLNKYQDWLKEWIVDGKGRSEEWKKNVLGQCKSWLDDGLQPRSVTRDLDWGVPVPVEGAAGKVLYVWLDAPIGYISATRQWAADHGKNWEPYWKDGNTKLVHFIGKDNIVFHCIIFPVILKAHGDFILPTNVPANEFMNLEGEKMSTSRNWAVQVHTYLHDFPGREDVLRYVLACNLPEAKDSEFTWKDFQARNNNELVAILGNYVNRVLVLTHKFFEGRVPALQDDFLATQYMVEYRNNQQRLVSEVYEPAMETYRFREALSAMMDVVRTGNKLLTDYEPWKLYKTDPASCGSVLRVCLDTLSDIALLAEPFLPFTSKKINEILGQGHDGSARLFNSQLTDNQQIGAPVHLFSPIEDAIVEAQISRLQANNQIAAEKSTTNHQTFIALKPEIAFEDFAKMDIRTGVILEAESIPKADKLLKLKVDLGFEQRTIVSGIAAHFSPETLPGRRVLVLANLAPRTMRGVESQGMILMAEGSDGSLHFAEAGLQVEPGSVLS
jgi:methionyl-tRNA synthetase